MFLKYFSYSICTDILLQQVNIIKIGGLEFSIFYLCFCLRWKMDHAADENQIGRDVTFKINILLNNKHNTTATT